ncbi:MAG: hypothetical protein AAB680_03060, partial [Pseudomonadota bacterium]
SLRSSFQLRARTAPSANCTACLASVGIIGVKTTGTGCGSDENITGTLVGGGFAAGVASGATTVGAAATGGS